MADKSTKPTILALGGLDPTGGAGIILDCAAAQALEVHSAAVLTVMTIQDGERFFSARPEPSEVVQETTERMLSQFEIGAVKTGALGSASIVETIARLADRPSFPPLVVDPVIYSTTGGSLLCDQGVTGLRDQLIPAATLVTPNLAEAEILTGQQVQDEKSMVLAATRLVEMGAGAALVKGGHLNTNDIADVFVDSSGDETIFPVRRLDRKEVRGTGCALASLIAALLAGGHPLKRAVLRAQQKLHEAIRNARPIGNGPAILHFSSNY